MSQFQQVLLFDFRAGGGGGGGGGGGSNFAAFNHHNLGEMFQRYFGGCLCADH